MKSMKEIMEAYHRPFYYYEEAVIARQIGALKAAFPDFEILYSIKTNPFGPIVRFIAASGIGADAASAGEVELAVQAGMKREQIIYSAPGKTKEELLQAVDKAIITADSYHELELLEEIAAAKGETLKVGLRINPDFTMDSDVGSSGKFGVDEESLLEHSYFFNSLAHLKIVGIHVHVRSQVLDHTLLRRYYEKNLELALFCQEKMGWQLEYINFGGGLGVAYSNASERPLDLISLSRGCKELAAKYKEKLSARLILETGRFLVCQAGTYVTPVVDKKVSRGKTYLLVQNTFNGFSRPSLGEFLGLYVDTADAAACEPLFTREDAYAFGLLGKSGEEEVVTIMGNLCTAADKMASNVSLPKAEIGDILTVSNAGSYAYTLSPVHFANLPAPMQVYVQPDGGYIVEE